MPICFIYRQTDDKDRLTVQTFENSIDILGDVDNFRYKKAFEKIACDKNLDIIFTILTSQDKTPVEKVVNAIIEFS
ncbi:MAG: hypothetical protein KAT32_02775 [Candidatus Moranbacteria bacterium]|nr:hypothetical protein [Candidatus Moranbacteria bacterium]